MTFSMCLSLKPCGSIRELLATQPNNGPGTRAHNTVLRCSSKRELVDTSRGADQNSQEPAGPKSRVPAFRRFLIRNQQRDLTGKLRDITNAAARSGVVIYSMDTRGLVASLNDASTESGFDPSGRLERAKHGELLATQDGMNALAVDTGGKAVFNTNDLRKDWRPLSKKPRRIT